MIRHKFILACALVVAAACSKDSPSYEKNSGETVTLSAQIVTPETVKTWVDKTSSETILPVYWSDGDAINVNGQSSSPVSVKEGEKLTRASFELRSVQAPYNVIYPSSIVTDPQYSSEGTIRITIPSSQEYDSVSFASGSVILCGYSEKAGGSISLKNICSVVRVTLTSASADNKIEMAEITALGQDDYIAGEYSIQPSGGKLEVVSGEKTIGLDIADPVLLGEAGSDFWFSVPSDTYPGGFELSFTRESDRRKMICKWTPSQMLEAGRIYHFSDVVFVPGAKDIETPDDWNEFAAACNTGGDLSKWIFSDGYAHIGADINAEDLLQIVDFDKALDGKNHIIARTNATGSLFGEISGEIKNLTLEGAFESAPPVGAALATSLSSGGLIESCTNNMEISLALCDNDIALAGIVGTMEGGRIVKCTNRGSITATVDLSSTNHSCQVAGIVAKVAPVQTDTISLEDCLNTGTICFRPKAPGNHDHCPTFMGLGGIAGYLKPADGVFFKLDNCDNDGNIIFSGEGITHESGMSASPLSVGGIVGLAATVNSTGTAFSVPGGTNGLNISFADCDNTGAVSNNGVNYSTSAQAGNKSFSGGIVGSITGNDGEGMATFSNCRNTGSVIPYNLTGDASSNRAQFCSVIGGMAGFGAYVKIENCYINCALGDGKRPIVAIGGAIGYNVRPFRILDSHIYYNGYFQRVTGYKSNRSVAVTVPVKYTGGSAMGIVPDITGSEITNSSLGATLNTSVTTSTSYSKDDLVVAGAYNAVIFIEEKDAMNNLVCGENLSDEQKSQVTKTGNQYWNGF